MDISGNVDVIFWVFGGSTISFIACAFMTKVTNDDNKISGGSGQEENGQLSGFYPSTLVDNAHTLSIEDCDPKKPSLVTSNTYNRYQEKEKILHCNNKSYQSIPLINNIAHDHHDNDNIRNKGDNNIGLITHEITTTVFKLSKTKSQRSILSTAHTLRDEADEQLERTDSVDINLAISQIASLEQPMGVDVFANNSNSNGESSSSRSNVVHISEEGEQQHESLFQLLFNSPRILCFLITTLLFGIVLSMIVNFLFLFLNHDLHTPTSWIGWTGPLGGITELLCFCFSKEVRVQVLKIQCYTFYK